MQLAQKSTEHQQLSYIRILLLILYLLLLLLLLLRTFHSVPNSILPTEQPRFPEALSSDFLRLFHT
jgi:hypothetical protein